LPVAVISFETLSRGLALIGARTRAKIVAGQQRKKKREKKKVGAEKMVGEEDFLLKSLTESAVACS